jgi:hypothetical protein
MSQDKDPNQGEGDRISARRYDRNVRDFVAEGKVPDAANEAKTYVERDPDDAAKAEEKAKRGPIGTRVSIDDLVAKGQTVVERARPIISKVVGNLRARFGRK